MSASIPPTLQRTYDAILQQMGASEHFIGNDESVPRDRLFPHAMNSWSNHRVLYVYEPSHDPGERPTEREYYGYVVGRTGSFEDGQRVGAAGATQPNVTINDQSHVKQHIVLLPIHPGHDDMDDLAHDQAVGFHDLTVALAGGQNRYDDLQRDSNVLMRLLTNDNAALYKHGNVAIAPFKIVTEDLYTVTSKNVAKKQTTAAPTRTNRKRKADDDHESTRNAEAGPSRASSSTSSTNNDSSPASPAADNIPTSTIDTPGPDDVTLDARYHFNVLPDHVGPRFQHRDARVVQFNIRDVHNQLIPPWRYPIALRAGTIALGAVGIRLWEMPGTGNGRTSFTFQMVLKSLKVLKESDMPEDSITTSTEPHVATREHAPSSIPAEIANDLASFSIPLADDDDAGMHDATEVEDERPAPSSVAKGKKKRTY